MGFGAMAAEEYILISCSLLSLSHGRNEF